MDERGGAEGDVELAWHCTATGCCEGWNWYADMLLGPGETAREVGAFRTMEGGEVAPVTRYCGTMVWGPGDTARMDRAGETLR